MAQFTNQAQLSFRDSVVNSNVAVGEILEPLTAAKTAIPAVYTAGDTITYVVSMVNSGAAVLNGITVTDNLGAYAFGGTTLYPLTYLDGSARLFVDGVLQPAPVVTAGPPLTVTGINLPAGADLVLIYQTTVNQLAPLTQDAQITNSATISGAGVVAPITVSETITASAAPDLTITKSIEPVPVAENGTVTYTFLIQNYGPAATVATDDVTLTDLFDPILRGIVVTLDGETLVAGTDYTYDQTSGLFVTTPGRITVPGATFMQDPVTGAVTTVPGTVQLTVTGTIS